MRADIFAQRLLALRRNSLMRAEIAIFA